MNQKIKYIGLLALLPLLTVPLTINYAVADTAQAYSYVLYSVNLGGDKYFIHFNVCANEKSLDGPDILIKSEKDTVQINSTKIIYENSCQGFESIIDTRSSGLISITILE